MSAPSNDSVPQPYSTIPECLQAMADCKETLRRMGEMGMRLNRMRESLNNAQQETQYEYDMALRAMEELVSDSAPQTVSAAGRQWLETTGLAFVRIEQDVADIIAKSGGLE